MKKVLYVTITLLMVASCAQQQPRVSVPEIDLTPSTRAIADSEKEMFELVKYRINNTALHVNDPAEYPAMTPEDEATWKAQDYYILDEAKFLEDPDLSRLVACSATNPKIAFFVGRLQTGEYRSSLAYPMESGAYAVLHTPNYEDVLAWLEKRMGELNCRDYKIVRIKGVEYYIFNAGGTIHLFNPMGDEMTCAQIVDLLQSK